MPSKKEYSVKTVGKGASRTPKSVMGSQGKPAPIKPMHNPSKPTARKPFPQS